MEVRVLFRAPSVEDEQIREPAMAPFFVSQIGFKRASGSFELQFHNNTLLLAPDCFRNHFFIRIGALSEVELGMSLE